MTIRHLYPAVEPSLNLDFANSKKLDSRITFTRGSTGTYTDESGIIRTAAANEARFDHDSDGNSLGLLIEESRTNYLLNSEAFNLWSNPYGLTFSTNSTTAPDGSLTADKIIETTGLYNGISQTPQAFSGNFTVSVYAKKAERKYVALRILDTNANQTGITVDLDTGEITLTVGILANLLGTKVDNLSNGWFRISCTYAASQAGRNVHVWVSKDGTENGPNRIPTYTGDGTSGIYLWGGQLEAGTFPTSYIPTAGATATRAADLASITGTNFSSWYNQSEGTFLMVESASQVPQGNTHRLEIYRNGAANTDCIAHVAGTGSNFTRLVGRSASSPTGLDVQANNTWSTTRGARAIALKQDNCALARGSSSASDTSSVFPQNLDALGFGSPANTFQSNAVGMNTLARLTYYPVRLPDATLQALTL